MNNYPKRAEKCTNCPNRKKISRLAAKIGILGQLSTDCPGPNTIDYIRTTEEKIIPYRSPEDLKWVIAHYRQLGQEFDPNKGAVTVVKTEQEGSVDICHFDDIPRADGATLSEVFQNSEGRLWARVQLGVSRPVDVYLDDLPPGQIYPLEKQDFLAHLSKYGNESKFSDYI